MLPSPAPLPARAVVRSRGGVSAVHRGRSSGPLRLLFPKTGGRAAWIVTSSLGGGLVHGDAADLEVDVGPGAVGLITTQSSTKVYRGTSSQRTTVRVAEGGVALIVPDPVAAFRGARLVQSTRVTLAEGASAFVVDVLTAGRVAHGERWASDFIDSDLAISIGEVEVFRDRLVLDPGQGDLAQRMGRFDAIGTVVFCGPAIAAVAEEAAQATDAAPLYKDATLIAAASRTAHGAVLRFAATTVEEVVSATREVAARVCARFGEHPFEQKR